MRFVMQLLINGFSCNVPLEKLRAVGVPNPRMPRVLKWYDEAVPDLGFRREMVSEWHTMISDSKLSQWRNEADVFDCEAQARQFGQCWFGQSAFALFGWVKAIAWSTRPIHVVQVWLARRGLPVRWIGFSEELS